MQNYITIWGIIFAIGLGSFYLSVIYIIPTGYRDMLQLFKDLNKNKDD